MNSKILTGIFLMLFCLQVFAAADYGNLAETTISFLPASIHAGDTVSMSIAIENKGSVINIQDLTASIDLSAQLEEVVSLQSIELIKPKASSIAVLSFKVKETTLPGYYPVFLTLSYLREGNIVTQTETVSVPVSGAQKKIDVTVNPNVINPGNQTELIFTLSNVGGTSVSNIAFSWTEENDLILPVGSDNKRYADFLNNENSVELKYLVAADPNIATGIYPLTVSMTFTDSNGTTTQSSQVGLIVGGKTDFEVSAENSNGTLSLSIANIGSNNADAVVVKIIEPANMVSGSKIQILGNLDKGDFTLANFETSAGSSMTATASTETIQQNSGLMIPGLTGGMGGRTNTQRTSASTESNSTELNEKSIPSVNNFNEVVIQIDYTDTTGIRQSVQKTISLNSSNTVPVFSGTNVSRNSNSFPLIEIALLAVILISAVAFNKFKAKKDWKKLGLFLTAIIIAFIALYFFLQNFLLIGLILISVIALGLFFKNELIAFNFFKKSK
ncbi:MAG: hypothetical protein JW703_04950 [Candidatus Diapherotrites archaeon]|nr:hypothetical protein [Candidatus Diapherotrites archaeon]